MSQDARPGERTLEEHHSCMQLVDAVEGAINVEAAGTGWLDQLHGCLTKLSLELGAHFERETQGYLFQELPARFPRFAARLDRLGTEHSSIITGLSGLLGECDQVRSGTDQDRHKLCGRVQLLVSTIRRHEAEENEILISAHWDDLGECD